MPKIDEMTIRRVKDAVKIEDVIGDFVTLRKAGVNMTGLCPFHDDQNDGNFIVRPSTIPDNRGGNTYRCFVCDKKGDAIKFLMEHERLSYPDAIRWLGKKFNEPVDDVPLNYTPPPPRPKPVPPPLLEIPREWVTGLRKRHYDNLFIRWLYTLPWSAEGLQRLQSTLWQYCVMGWQDGRVVFWQIDHEGTVRCAKLMRYLPDGHRDKQEHPGWIYNQKGIRERLDPDHHTILRPLFGAHLLKAYPQAPVNVVESEKTAIIMANYYGDPQQGLWLACGGLNWLNLDSMQPLIDQGRTVWLWPDRDGVEKWQQVCDKLGADNVRVYTDFFRTSYVAEDDGPKADIADIAIRLMGGGRLPRHNENDNENEQNHTGDPQPPTILAHGGSAAATPDPTTDCGERPDGVTDEEWLEHLSIMKAIKEWNLTHVPDEPFPGNTPLQQLMHDRVEESKRLKKQLKQQQNNERQPEE